MELVSVEIVSEDAPFLLSKTMLVSGILAADLRAQTGNVHTLFITPFPAPIFEVPPRLCLCTFVLDCMNGWFCTHTPDLVGCCAR